MAMRVICYLENAASVAITASVVFAARSLVSARVNASGARANIDSPVNMRPSETP